MGFDVLWGLAICRVGYEVDELDLEMDSGGLAVWIGFLLRGMVASWIGILVFLVFLKV